ncbi:UNVERIFIED_CONTAM: hypothetical protein Scaly_1596500 [Sesamum calycinum]|uniref:Transposon protein, putative, CACTA, En/Spm sub-class n=1 Tax=Sesamum calycinum TaxID=2727403 RepID=A0AAW2P953_9LAMI
MYNKNLLGRADLTPEFKNGVKTSMEWAKGQRRHMDGDKIRCPCQKCKNTKFGTPDKEYFEAPSVPQVSEATPTGHVEGNYPQWGDEQHIDWAQRMVFDAARPSYFAFSHEGVTDDGTRSCSVDVGTSSYVYGGGGPYDYYESRILPSNHTLSGDYYSTKKLVKDLGLPVEKIHVCKNGCMLYWKDDVDLEYCKFYGEGRYKPARGRDPHQKKSLYAVLRSCLNELYQHHHPADPIIDQLVSIEFKDWFKRRGPSAEVTLFNAYFVNGYNFQTERHNTGKSTMNCRVCVKSSSCTDEENNFYEIIKEIIQLAYPLIPNLHIVLFKCRWVDPVQGMKVHPSYHLIDVNFKKLYQKDDPFIFAQQAVQVYFMDYPIAYQPEEVVSVPIVAIGNQSYDLRDPNGLQVVLEAVGTSWRQLHENDDDNEDKDEDSGGDDKTDDEEYEAT